MMEAAVATSFRRLIVAAPVAAFPLLVPQPSEDVRPAVFVVHHSALVALGLAVTWSLWPPRAAMVRLRSSAGSWVATAWERWP